MLSSLAYTNVAFGRVVHLTPSTIVDQATPGGWEEVVSTLWRYLILARCQTKTIALSDDEMLHLTNTFKCLIEPTFSMCMVCQQRLAYHFQRASGQMTDRGTLRRCPVLHATAPPLPAAAICKTRLSCLGQKTMCSTRKHNTGVLQRGVNRESMYCTGATLCK